MKTFKVQYKKYNQFFLFGPPSKNFCLSCYKRCKLDIFVPSKWPNFIRLGYTYCFHFHSTRNWNDNYIYSPLAFLSRNPIKLITPSCLFVPFPLSDWFHEAITLRRLRVEIFQHSQSNLIYLIKSNALRSSQKKGRRMKQNSTQRLP